jgi:hypothetical protein
MSYARTTRLTRFRALPIVGRQFLFRKSETERQDRLPELKAVNDCDGVQGRLELGIDESAQVRADQRLER